MLRRLLLIASLLSLFACTGGDGCLPPLMGIAPPIEVCETRCRSEGGCNAGSYTSCFTLPDDRCHEAWIWPICPLGEECVPPSRGLGFGYLPATCEPID
jgi:hypothetical protein